jgi:xylulose-5-phosphate/fructose-6-phosphate phosphoketolase
VNGFKINERTIYGCMDDEYMAALFIGYGYQPRVEDDLDYIDTDLSNSMEWALS